ncbi:MAG: GerMN domain-containing protein [Acidimicrobiales bacterium]
MIGTSHNVSHHNVSHPRSGLRRAWVAGVAMLAMAGCGVGTDAQPQVLAPEKVPYSLLTPSTTPTTGPVTPTVAQMAASVYLVDNETSQLVEVQRSVPAPPSVRSALEELIKGPTEAELTRGLRSNIARSTVLRGVSGPDGGVVTVDLSDLTGIAGQGQRLALAQVVFTVTAAPDVQRVLFAFAGEPSEVPNGQGESTGRPLGREDFATFDPNVPSTVPATTPPPSDPGQPSG